MLQRSSPLTAAASLTQQSLLARYQQAAWTTKFFLKLRWELTPYERMAAHLPSKGLLLDLGCGHGLFSLAAALVAPGLRVQGIDHDQERISLAQHALRGLPNVSLQAGSILTPQLPGGQYAALAMIDVMHYFDPVLQEELIAQAYRLLADGGRLLVREVDPNAGVASLWNRLYEKIATTIGFTQVDKSSQHFRNQTGWQRVLEQYGFSVKAERCSSLLFADILYVCEKKPDAKA